MCLLRVLASCGKDLRGSVFLEALADREEANRNGKMTVSENGCYVHVHVCFLLSGGVVIYSTSVWHERASSWCIEVIH